MAQPLEKVPLTPLRDNPQQDAIWKRWLAVLALTVTGAEHNLLEGLQGGTTDEYYHLTAAQHTALGTLGAFDNNAVVYADSTGALKTEAAFGYNDSTNTLSVSNISLGLTGSITGASDNYFPSIISRQTSFTTDTANPLIYVSASGGTYPFANFGNLVFQTDVVSGGARDIVFASQISGTVDTRFIFQGSTGYVRIGSSTAPTVALDVTGSAAVSGILGVGRTVGASSGIYLPNAAGIYWADSGGTDRQILRFTSGNEVRVTAAGTASFISFYIGATEFAKITNGGVFTTNGDTTLGDASADTLRINAGTWTYGANWTASRAAGALATGPQRVLYTNVAYSGDAGGATNARAFRLLGSVSGANALIAAIGLEVGTTNTATNTISVQQGVNSAVTVSSSGNVSNGAAYATAIALTSTGNITTCDHYLAVQPTLSSTGAITTLNGLRVTNQGNALVSTAVGVKVDDFTNSPTAMRGIQSSLTAGTDKHNLYIDGSAPNYVATILSVGSTTYTSARVNVSSSTAVQTGTVQYGYLFQGQFDSTVATTSAAGFASFFVLGGAGTVTDVKGYTATGGTIGSATITSYSGYDLNISALSGPTNIYAFRSKLSSASGRWNLYMDGTANNYIAGFVSIGTTSASYPLTVNTTTEDRAISFTNTATNTGAADYGIAGTLSVNNASGANGKHAFFAAVNHGPAFAGTSNTTGFYSANTYGNAITHATGYTRGFAAILQITAAATVTSFVGLDVEVATNTGGGTLSVFHGVNVRAQTVGTSIYGFRGQIAAASGRYNLYMDGTAQNVLAGNLRIGSTAAPNIRLDVISNTASDGIKFTETSNVTMGGFMLENDTGATWSAIIARSGASNAGLAVYTSSVGHAFTTNVRIGSSVAPTVALDVTGAALISSTLTVSSLTSGRFPLVSTSGLITSSATFNYIDTSSIANFSVSGSVSSIATIAVGNEHTTGIAVLGASTLASGDALVRLVTDGDGAFNSWTIGIDQSDSARLVVSTGSNLGAGSDVVEITRTGSVILNASGAALITTATDGFTYVPSCAGTPTGTPTAVTGAVPIVVDSTNNKLYFYSGGSWRDAGP